MAGTLFCGIAFAQQSSAPASSQAPASTTTAPKAQKPAASSAASKPAASEAAKKPAAAPFTLKTDKDKTSYAIGMNIGRNIADGLKKDSVAIDIDVLARGLKDVLADKKTLLTDDEAKAVLTALSGDIQKRQQATFQAAVEKNKKEGDAYLAANKSKPGVVTLPSGLQYKVIQEGTGPKPAVTDTVECNYKGTLVDGTEFDSSYKRGQPAKFPVNQVIKGWTEALQLMPVGSKWELVIPPTLGYGERGTPNGGPIGPNATLVFEVELMSIQPKAAAAPPAPQPQAQPQAQPQQQTPPPQPQAKPQ
jgi:FKBP-type peptidyl-prolyl cis-trans isomerase